MSHLQWPPPVRRPKIPYIVLLSKNYRNREDFALDRTGLKEPVLAEFLPGKKRFQRRRFTAARSIGIRLGCGQRPRYVSVPMMPFCIRRSTQVKPGRFARSGLSHQNDGYQFILLFQAVGYLS